MLRAQVLAGVLLAASLAVPLTAGAAVITTPLGVLDDASGLSWRKLSASSGLSFNTLGAQLAPAGSLSGYRLASAAEVGTLLSDRFAGVTGNSARKAAFLDFANAIGATLRDGAPFDGTTLELGGIVSGIAKQVTVTPIDSSFKATGPAVPDGTHLAFSVLGTGLVDAPGNTASIVYPFSAAAFLPNTLTTGYSLGPLNNPDSRRAYLLGQGYDTSQTDNELPSTVTGFWLVQASAATAVPEPAAAALLSAALLGLAWVRRRPG